MKLESLSGKTAVVTGASKGIGFAIASRFAKDDANVFLVASNAQRLKSAVTQIYEATGKKVAYCASDLRSLEGCEAAVKAALKFSHNIDILVNAAGATKGGSFSEQPDIEMIDGFALKFYGAVRLCRLFWPNLKNSAGVVINIVGGFARTPDPDFIVGTSVNAALAGFTKALAGQGLRDDINVNWVHPGITVTDRMEEIFAARAKMEGKKSEEVLMQKVEEEKIRRLGQPEDVSALVAFLCSPEARHIHGIGVPVDGGGGKGYY